MSCSSINVLSLATNSIEMNCNGGSNRDDLLEICVEMVWIWKKVKENS